WVLSAKWKNWLSEFMEAPSFQTPNSPDKPLPDEISLSFISDYPSLVFLKPAAAEDFTPC
uniref:hypothetical protein n=1 Tax=uncultured Sutterella sp. TaxID=286133 RepID=UPI0025E3FDD2